MVEISTIEGGFADPVFESQSVFRALMDAMARPGTVHCLQPTIVPPAPLTPTAAAVVLTLCDHDTPLWLDPALAEEAAISKWLGFHSGAPLAEDPDKARFALVADPGALADLGRFAQGSQEYPDRSATLILQVETLESGVPLRLEGPGIEERTHLAPAPMPAGILAQWSANHARFPRGVDLILAAQRHLACLPRTTKITGESA